MKAAILVELNQPLVVDDISLPEQLLFGQVLVKIHYSGICGSQIHEIDGIKGPDRYLPHLLGHEGSGTVVEVGPGVSRVKEGETVVLHWRKSDGVNSSPPQYQWNGKKINAGWITTFNEYAIVSENRLTVIPSDFDKKIAPLFGCAITTGFGVITNDAQVKIGQSVVVFGVGGVGINICQAAQLVSAYPIIAVDLQDTKLEMAIQFGATNVFNSNLVSDLDAQIHNIVGSSGADVVIDTTGNPHVIEKAYNLTSPDGQTILVGVPKAGDNVSIYTLPLHFNKILKGSHGGGSMPHIEIPRYIKLVKIGKLKLDGLIAEEFPLGNINHAIDLCRQGVAGRILITM